MKILLLGDTHLRVRTPKSRTESDFMLDVCINKLHQAIDIYKENDCELAIQVGDFFDIPDPSKALMASVISLFRKYNFKPLVIHGQHDMLYHSELSIMKSSLRVLDAAEAITVSDPILNDSWVNKEIRVYGCPFSHTPEKLSDSIIKDNLINVLVAHTMVGDKPLFPGHDLTGPEQYVKKYPGYDLYVLGDYHYPFTVKVGKSLVVNPGAMIRLSSAVRDKAHKPKVVIYDTYTMVVEDIFLDVGSIDESFKKEVEKSESLLDIDILVAQLSKGNREAAPFRERLEKYLEDKKVDKKVKDIIGNSLFSYDNKEVGIV